MKKATNLDKAFSALAHPHRRAIITALSLQPLSISRLAEFQGLSLPAIHKHLKLLDDAGLLQRRKIGRSNFLVLNYEALAGVQEWILKHQTHWGSAVATLANYDPANFSKTAHKPSAPNSRKGRRKANENNNLKENDK